MTIQPNLALALHDNYLRNAIVQVQICDTIHERVPSLSSQFRQKTA